MTRFLKKDEIDIEIRWQRLQNSYKSLKELAEHCLEQTIQNTKNHTKEIERYNQETKNFRNKLLIIKFNLTNRIKLTD